MTRLARSICADKCAHHRDEHIRTGFGADHEHIAGTCFQNRIDDPKRAHLSR